MFHPADEAASELKIDESLVLGSSGQPPIFSSALQGLSAVAEGDDIFLSAQIFRVDLSTKFKFFHNNRLIPPHNPRFEEGYRSGIVSLRVKNAKKRDAGTYTCRATNKFGKAEEHFELEVV